METTIGGRYAGQVPRKIGPYQASPITMQATWSFPKSIGAPQGALKDTKAHDQSKIPASPFLELPPEIRNQIYKMLFENAPTATCSMYSEATPITQVCSQIRQECHGMWYSHQKITVCNAECLERFLESRPTQLNVGKLLSMLTVEWLTNIGDDYGKAEREVKKVAPVLIDLLRSHQFGDNVTFHVRAFGRGTAQDICLQERIIQMQLLVALYTAMARDRISGRLNRREKRRLKKKFCSKHFGPEEEEEYRRIAGEDCEG